MYRMHPLIPDDFAFHSLRDRRGCSRRSQLPEIAGPQHAGDRRAHHDAGPVLLVRRVHPGAITLHNYPRHLQNLTRDDGEHLDLAAVDILRDRERGVPRYNQFRRLLHKDPVKSFDETHRQRRVAEADQRGLQRTTSRRST